MKVIIIEDEALAAQRLKKMILDYDSGIEIVAELESVEESINWFNNNDEPDLIFLDIHLEDDLSFAIFEKVSISSPIIFTTAFDEYAIKAFKLKSIDYLLKPIVQEELNAALKKYREMTKFQGNSNELNSLYELIVHRMPKYRERFAVTYGQKIKTFSIDEVAYFLSLEGSTSAYLQDGKSYPVDQSIEKLTGEIDPDSFFRINRQLLVRLEAIQNVHVYPKSRLKLDIKPSPGFDVFVSIDKVVPFKDWLGGRK
jgi:DNA-binding LytR/AlgR family response regulator